MNRARPWLAGGAVALAAGAALWWAVEQRAEQVASLKVIRDLRVQRERALARLEENLTRAQATVAKARADYATRSKLASTEKTPPLANPATKGAVDAPALTLSELVKRGSTEGARTEAELRWWATQRATIGARYTSLSRTLGLTARQQEALTENMMQRDQRNRDLTEAAQAQGYDPSDAPISKLRGGIYVDYEAAQRALLGDAGYGALVEFDRTSSLHGIVGNLAGAAAVAGVPLTPGQTTALIRTMAEASSSYQRGGSAFAFTVDWGQLRGKLPTLLSEQQVMALSGWEPPGASGGLHHAEWNTALVQATKAEREKKAEMANASAGTGSRGGK